MQIQNITSEVFDAARSVKQIEPFLKRGMQFCQTKACAVVQKVADMLGGETLGRKIGFSNRSIWPTMTNKKIEYAATGYAAVSLLISVSLE